MVKEIWNVLNYKAFHPVKVSSLTSKQLKSIIRSSMFLKEKYLPSGEFDKLKARFVAGGNLQDRSLYEKEDITSPTINTWSVLLMAAIAAKEKRKVMTIDVQSTHSSRLPSSVDLSIFNL